MPTDSARLTAWRPTIPEFARCAVVTKEEATKALHPAEEALLHPQAVPARIRSFRLGRSAAHIALAAMSRDEGPILAGDHREPIWPPGVMGSISHTTDIGVALVAPATRADGVGVDVEHRRYAPELETRVPRPEEQAWLAVRPQAKKADDLLALFSAKESIFKALFPTVGSFFGFHAALLEPAPSGYVARLVEPVSKDYPPGRKFVVSCEWIGATVVTWLVLPKNNTA